MWHVPSVDSGASSRSRQAPHRGPAAGRRGRSRAPTKPSTHEAEHPRRMQILTIIEQDGRHGGKRCPGRTHWPHSRTSAMHRRAYRRARTRGHASSWRLGDPRQVSELDRCSMIARFRHVGRVTARCSGLGPRGPRQTRRHRPDPGVTHQVVLQPGVPLSGSKRAVKCRSQGACSTMR